MEINSCVKLRCEITDVLVADVLAHELEEGVTCCNKASRHNIIMNTVCRKTRFLEPLIPFLAPAACVLNSSHRRPSPIGSCPLVSGQNPSHPKPPLMSELIFSQEHSSSDRQRHH